jgi:PHP family Zn ribbon phosphoesterase
LQLADRPEGAVPETSVPFKRMIPFDEFIAEAKGVAKGAVSVEREYMSLMAKFGTEFDILLRASREDLQRGLPKRIAEGVLRVREGKVNIKAGYDGEYGIISIFGAEDSNQESHDQQLSLF